MSTSSIDETNRMFPACKLPCSYDPKSAIRPVVISALGVSLLVASLLTAINVIPLPPLAAVGMAAVGGGMAFAAIPAPEEPRDFFTRIATIALQILAVVAIVIGSLGISGVISALQGTPGACFLGGGVIVFGTLSHRFFCNYPFQQQSEATKSGGWFTWLR